MADFDALIIGAGSAGYVSAIRAAQLGGKVGLIEEKEIGGTCLNRGCIPTKALLRSAEVFHLAGRSSEFGITVDVLGFDFPSVMERKGRIVDRLVKGVAHLLKGNGVEVFEGRGRVVEPGTIEVTARDGGKELLKSKTIIIATGSEPAMLPAFNIDRTDILTSDEALELASPPESLFVVGAGAIGIEFAEIYNSFGSSVTIAEMLPQVLPDLNDLKITQILRGALEKKGIRVLTDVKTEKIEKGQGKVVSTLSSGEETEAEKALLCTGRSLNSEGIGLEELGVGVEEGRIVANEKMETNIPGIYAIGDVVGGTLLAHKASREGIVAAENAMGGDSRMDYRAVPNCVFSSPEVAWVGLTEAEAKEEGYEISAGEFPYVASGRALCAEEREGFVRVVADSKTNEILGGQVIGAQADILISELTLALQQKLKSGDLADLIHAHPTLPEMLAEAAGDVTGESIHRLRKS